MHTHTILTKFTFGDQVIYYSPTQGGVSGSGKILFITFDGDGFHDYMILKPDGEVQPGILEEEIQLINSK